MNKENFEISKEFKKECEQKLKDLNILIKLKEFKKTRAIATAVEICDMMLKDWE